VGRPVILGHTVVEERLRRRCGGPDLPAEVLGDPAVAFRAEQRAPERVPGASNVVRSIGFRSDPIEIEPERHRRRPVHLGVGSEGAAHLEGEPPPVELHVARVHGDAKQIEGRDLRGVGHEQPHDAQREREPERSVPGIRSKRRGLPQPLSPGAKSVQLAEVDLVHGQPDLGVLDQGGRPEDERPSGGDEDPGRRKSMVRTDAPTR
jgi:hypothetical protein